MTTEQHAAASTAAPPEERCDRPTQITKSLLGYGVLAGPVYVLAAGVQAVTRDGFDPTRHDVSLLANGPLGWIQVVNFLLVGAMVVAAAVGMGRALRGTRGGTWGSRLVGVYGAGLIGAGIFRADPAFGFPPGTPDGAGTMTWHGLAHLATGGVGFLALIAAGVVFARRFAGMRKLGWAAYSLLTSVVFFAGFGGIATGSGAVVATIGFTVAVCVAWAWLAALSVHLYRHAAAQQVTGVAR